MGQPGSPGSLRLLNAQRILDALLADRAGPMSRAEIARATGLSKPTVSGLVAELERADLLRPVGQDRSGAVGRPALPYEVAPDGGFVLAADIGASEIILGVTDLVGRTRAERELKTGSDADEAIVQVAAAAHQLQEELECTVSVACVGISGVYHQEAGVVGEALNLPGLHGMRVAERLEAALGVPVQVDNDVNLAARGEASAMPADDRSDFVAVSVGTGIGAGLILEGALYRGGRDAAGEIGTLIVPSHHADDGMARSLEQIASAPGLERTFRRQLERGTPTTLPSTATAHEILNSDGDPAATTAVAIAADAMALAIATTTLVLNPRRIVFGGDIGANPAFVTAVETALTRYTTAPTELVPSTLGRRATLVGATMLALDALQATAVPERLTGDRAQRLASASLEH